MKRNQKAKESQISNKFKLVNGPFKDQIIKDSKEYKKLPIWMINPQPKTKRISKNTAYKTCEHCKKEFECNFRPTRTKYCSVHCRDRAALTKPERKEYEKQYRHKNNDRIKQTQKQCYENKREYYIKKSKENAQKNPNRSCVRLKTLDYKKKKLRYVFEIRCGVCNICRAVEKIDTFSTQRHHDDDKYFDDDPLKNTIEICVNCHAKETFTKNRNVQKNINKKEK